MQPEALDERRQRRAPRIAGKEHRLRGGRRHIGLLDAGDEPHRAQTTSTLENIDAKTRFSSAAQSRRYVDATDVDGTDVDFGDDGGGDVFDTCGSAGGSAPSLVDAGRGTTLLHR